MSRWQLLAVDYDRTLTRHPHGLNPKVPAALARLRAAGVRVAVCSGQPLARLRASLPGLDAYAGENGAVAWHSGAPAPWTHPWPARPALVRALDAAGVPHDGFDVILDIDAAHAQALERVLLPAHGARVQRNVDRLNVGPAAATKGSGLAWVQQALGVPRERTVAMGDGENDVPLFEAAGLALAVADATPPARRAAHRVLAQEDGDAVCAVVDDLLAGRLAPASPGRAGPA